MTASPDPRTYPPPLPELLKGRSPESFFAESGFYPVRVSAAMARLEFAGCGEDYIRDVCHGRCCNTSSKDRPAFVYLTLQEGQKLAEHAGVPEEEMVTRSPIHDRLFINKFNLTYKKKEDGPHKGKMRCQFQDDDSGLCKVQLAGLKPTQCYLSPWQLSKKDTLIIGNRYKTLICFKDGPRMPAYRAFNSGLRRLFGDEGAQRIVDHFDADGGDIVMQMPEVQYLMLKDRTTQLHNSRVEAVKKGVSIK